VKSKEEKLLQMKQLHQDLDDEADELSLRRYLSPTEAHRHKKLKVLRLLVKEEIERHQKERAV